MDKKPLIGVSICVVVLLVLGSLSNVVGYQSMKSTVVNDSPLFPTRTQKATNQQQNILPSQYLGMEKGNLLQFPMRDNKTESLKKIIGIITNMSSDEFNNLIRKSKINIDKESIIKLLLKLNTVNDSLLRINQNFSPFLTVEEKAFSRPTINPWYPGCLIIRFIEFIGVLIFALFLMIYDKINPTSATCTVLLWESMLT